MDFSSKTEKVLCGACILLSAASIYCSTPNCPNYTRKQDDVPSEQNKVFPGWPDRLTITGTASAASTYPGPINFEQIEGGELNGS